MSQYELATDQADAIKNARINALRQEVTEKQFDLAIATATEDTEAASAAQAEIDDAKAAIDALLALD